jgi:hypothetical protein
MLILTRDLNYGLYRDSTLKEKGRRPSGLLRSLCVEGAEVLGTLAWLNAHDSNVGVSGVVGRQVIST